MSPTMQYYSTLKGNKIGSFAEMQVEIGSVIQSEVSHKEKNKYCIVMNMCGIPFCIFNRARNRMQWVGCMSWAQNSRR